MTDLAKIAAGVGKAAIFGFGASAGRSAGKKTSKHADSLIIVVVVLAICSAEAVPPLTLSLLVVLIPFSPVLVALYRRRKNHWSINPMRLSR
jgi:hypothetical protein